MRSCSMCVNFIEDSIIQCRLGRTKYHFKSGKVRASYCRQFKEWKYDKLADRWTLEARIEEL